MNIFFAYNVYSSLFPAIRDHFHLIIGRFIRQILALLLLGYTSDSMLSHLYMLMNCDAKSTKLYSTQSFFQKNVNISIEDLFLDIVDSVNQLTA